MHIITIVYMYQYHFKLLHLRRIWIIDNRMIARLAISILSMIVMIAYSSLSVGAKRRIGVAAVMVRTTAHSEETANTSPEACPE